MRNPDPATSHPESGTNDNLTMAGAVMGSLGNGSGSFPSLKCHGDEPGRLEAGCHAQWSHSDRRALLAFGQHLIKLQAKLYSP